MNGILKNELNAETEEEGWREWDTVSCAVLLFVVVASVEIFWREKIKYNRKQKRKWREKIKNNNNRH